jgi:uncharacterized damage-inducible protein DinB
MSNATSRSVTEIAFCDLQREIKVTRKVLERVPSDRLDWKPHEKSMPLGRLALHVAQLLYWHLNTVEDDAFDFAVAPPPPPNPTSADDILRMFDDLNARLTTAFSRFDDAGLQKIWSLRNGDTVLHQGPKSTILRIWCLNHLVHHRGQLCLYLRLLDVPVPTVYFNSADEEGWSFE